mmetsp:Transcript_14174/g.55775  ORF Transcript_14174/g.55775 Transcript_14174/m.55775 type:complete len:334 (+) Transcript_14174:1298-2299(+)
MSIAGSSSSSVALPEGFRRGRFSTVSLLFLGDVPLLLGDVGSRDRIEEPEDPFLLGESWSSISGLLVLRFGFLCRSLFERSLSFSLSLPLSLSFERSRSRSRSRSRPLSSSCQSLLSEKIILSFVPLSERVRLNAPLLPDWSSLSRLERLDLGRLEPFFSFGSETFSRSRLAIRPMVVAVEEVDDFLASFACFWLCESASLPSLSLLLSFQPRSRTSFFDAFARSAPSNLMLLFFDFVVSFTFGLCLAAFAASPPTVRYLAVVDTSRDVWCGSHALPLSFVSSRYWYHSSFFSVTIMRSRSLSSVSISMNSDPPASCQRSVMQMLASMSVGME